MSRKTGKGDFAPDRSAGRFDFVFTREKLRQFCRDFRNFFSKGKISEIGCPVKSRTGGEKGAHLFAGIGFSSRLELDYFSLCGQAADGTPGYFNSAFPKSVADDGSNCSS